MFAKGKVAGNQKKRGSVKSAGHATACNRGNTNYGMRVGRSLDPLNSYVHSTPRREANGPEKQGRLEFLSR